MRRRICVLAGLLLGLLPLLADVAQATDKPSVVVVGVPGLRWADVTQAQSPTLARLAASGSVGSLSIRTAAAITCPQDGWLTVGAGNRVRAGASCTSVRPIAGTRVAGFSAVVKDNANLDFGSVPGILASSLPRGDCVAAVGAAAALGAADRTGRVVEASASVDQQALRRCSVTLVSGPVVRDKADVTQADALVASVDAARPPGSVLLVVGLSDTNTSDRAHLHVAIAVGGAYGQGLLRSQSTRRTPYVQLIDVTPTVLQLRGAKVPSAVDGQPWQHVSRRAGPAALADQDRAAGAVRGALPWVVAAMVVLLVLGSGLVLTRRLRQAAVVLLVALAAPAGSYLANLAPWWRAPANVLVLLAITFAVAAVAAVPAFLLGERRSWVIAAGAVAGFTFVVLVGDVLTGSRLQMDSVLGYSPLVAGRFAGFGNVAYGAFGSAAVLLATALAIKRPGWPGALLVGAVAVVADGAPMWGSDVGGVLALVPAFAVLTLLCRGLQLSWRRMLMIGSAAVAVVLLFGLADYARPTSQQTHLGRFVGRLLHGGAGTVLNRKLHSDLDLLLANAATLLVPVLMAGALWLVLRPRPRLARAYARHPELRHGLLALSVLAVVGLLVNDSGIAIPAVAVLLGLPYVLVVLTGDTPAEPPAEGRHVLP